MTKSQMFIKAHQETKEIKKEYPEVNYRIQFGICLSNIMTKKELSKEELIEMIIEEETYEESFSKKSYFNQAKVWSKYGKERLYIPRNAYEQAGYVDLKSGEYYPTRPGNSSSFDTKLISQLIETIKN